jgi:hypothetical protein
MRTATICAVLLLAVGCSSKKSREAARDKPMSAPTSATAAAPAPAPMRPGAMDELSGGAGTKMAGEEGKMGRRDTAKGGLLSADKEKKDADKPDDDRGGKDEEQGVASRSWFPETFLFEPLVVTDDKGAAEVAVRVPDRLTSWHVLALAHSRAGAQGGATASFLGTLPVYVDLVVPPFLMSGDEIRLPVQVVNTTTEAVTTSLRVTAEGATLGAAPAAVTIAAAGSRVEYVSLKAGRPGMVQIHASLGGADAVVRTLEVLPTGRPVTDVRSGTLAAPRTITTTGPAGADPASDRVRLQVFPGALALLRSELGTAVDRGGLAEDAYALLLAGRAPALLASLGDKPDPEALRTIALLTGQRVVRYGRSLDVSSAALLARAALAHPDNPVLARLGERSLRFLAENQRPDGTFGGETGWTLQRLLVVTAECTRAVAGVVPADDAGRQAVARVKARASGAFERHLGRVEDAYTAAAILASGVVTGDAATKLRALVMAGIKDRSDGSRYLEVPAGVVRADGSTPSEADATALAVLALIDDPKAPVADLGATLLARYSPGWGWGDGRTSLVCLEAVLQLFKDPLPPTIKVVLTCDGKPVAEGQIESARTREVVTMTADNVPLAGAHTWELRADPPVPGLGFSLSLASWVPWAPEPAGQGLELALTLAPTMSVGRAAEIEVKAVAPAGRALRVEQSLPAGVQIDTVSLDALVSAGTITRYETADGRVVLYAPGVEPGRVFSARFRVVPTLAGTLHTSASAIALVDDLSTTFHVPPSVWTVR